VRIRRNAPLILIVFTLATAGCGSRGGSDVQTGDATHGKALYAAKCARCHGANGTGGTLAPRLAGASISLDDAKERLDEGASGMPAHLVQGTREEDVLAYLQGLLAQ
jgi:mono/diheme cytochrome c family protein